MKKRIVSLVLLCMAVMLMLTSCVADSPNDTTAGNDTQPTASATIAATEPTAAPTETQAPTEATTEPTEPEEGEPRQEGLRLNDKQLAYFQELFAPKGPPSVEDYYNLVLNQEFASIQDIDLFMFFEDGSPEDMKNEVTQSECDYYNQNRVNSHVNVHVIERLSYAFVTDVLWRYLGVTVPQMDMSTLVYNPSTGYYYRGSTGTYKHHPPKFTDGYYDEETGLLSLYYIGGYEEKERIVTLRYVPEAEITKFLIVSCLPADYSVPAAD